jgi:hypothetical protein
MSDGEFWIATGWAVLGVAYAALWIWLGVRIFNRRERWAKWTAVVAVVLPLIYLLSSGPMTIVAFRRHVKHQETVLPDGTTAVTATSETILGTWFYVTYAPLLWASEQSWGDGVFWYWELFPNRGVNEEP